jgi:hypothetical protein
MHEPDLSELSGAEMLLGIATAASAYFFPPLLILTLPALGLAMVRRVVPGTGDGAIRLLAAPVRAAREYIDTGAVPGFSLARRDAPQLSAPQDRQQRKAAPAGAPLRPAAWLRAVNDRPDNNPHLTVVGPSGSGKTTFVSAALGQRPGRVVVLTPKVSPGAWRGAEVVTLNDDLSYEPLAEALAALQTEAKRRALALKRGEPLEPLTVVLDELPELVAEVPAAGPFAVRLSRWGRELGMRQVVLATSDEALNVKGWAATRPNYVRVELDRPTDSGARPAWLDDGTGRQPLDLGSVKAGAERAQLQPWRPSATVEAPRPAIVTPAPAVEPADPQIAGDALDLLATMLAGPVSTASQSRDTGRGVSVSATSTPDTDTNTGGVSRTTATLVTLGEGPALRIDVHARAESAPQAERQRLDPQGRRRSGLDARRRRQLAEQRRAKQRKAELRAAYAERKAAGWSYRKAYAELGGASDDARAWWAAAPGPMKEAA